MKNALACEECNSTENLQNHHTRYVPEEFKTLCRDCHYKDHRKPGAPVPPDGFYPRPRRDWSRMHIDERGRLILPKCLREAAGIEGPGWVLVEAYPSLDKCKALSLSKES